MVNSIVNKLHLNKTVKKKFSLPTFLTLTTSSVCLLLFLFYSLSEQSSKICHSQSIWGLFNPLPSSKL